MELDQFIGTDAVPNADAAMTTNNTLIGGDTDSDNDGHDKFGVTKFIIVPIAPYATGIGIIIILMNLLLIEIQKLAPQ